MMTKCKFALVALLAAFAAFFAAKVEPAHATPLPLVNVQDFWDGDQTQYLQVLASLQDWLDNGSITSNTPSMAYAQGQLTGWINPVTNTAATTVQADEGLALATDAASGTSALPLSTDGALALTGAEVGASAVTAGATLLPIGYYFLSPYINKTIYRLFHSDSSLASATNFNPTWLLEGSGTISTSGFPNGITGEWYLQCGVAGHYTCNVGTGSPSVVFDYCVPDVANGGPATTANFNACLGTASVASSAIDIVMWNWLVAQASACTGGSSCANYPHIAYDTSVTNACNNSVVGECYQLTRTYSQMKTATSADSASSCSGTAYCIDGTGKQNSPPNVTVQQLTAMLQYLEAIAAEGGAEAAAAEAALLLIAAIANPNYSGPGTGTAPPGTVPAPWTVRMLPLPQEGETPSEYVDRVRTLGWIGTATITDDSTYEASLLGSGLCAITCDYLNQALGTISSLSLTGSTPTHFPTYDSAGTYAPPLTEPTLATATTPINIYIKPLTSSFPPGSSGPTTGTIDWTPITSTDMGSKFPFGAFNYIPAIDGPSTCPDLNIPWPSALGSGSSDISFCSTTWETDFRPWVFPIVEILMTVAGIAFLAFKVFGTSSGD